MPSSKLLKAFTAEADIQAALLAGLRCVVQELSLKPVVLFEWRRNSRRLLPLGAEGLDRGTIPREILAGDDEWIEETLQLEGATAIYDRDTLPEKLRHVFATSENLYAAPLSFAGERIGLLLAGGGVSLATDQIDDLSGIAAAFALYMANHSLKNRLERRQLLWTGLLKGLSLPVAVIDGRSRIVLWNEAMEQFTHNPSRSVEGGEVWTYLPKAVAEVGRYLLQRALQRRSPLSQRVMLEGQLPAHVGPRLLTVIPLSPEAGAGQTQSILIILPDSKSDGTGGGSGGSNATTREREFMSLIQHELRTPITSIRGAAHLLANTDPQKPLGESMSLVKIIEANTRRLDNHIIDIIDVAVLTNNELTLQPESLDLQELVGEAVAGFSQIIAQKKITFTSEFEEGLPPVSADASRFALVLRHLLHNAFKFTPVGGAVSMTARESNRFVEINLTDSGSGINPEFAPRAFEKFTQEAPHLTRQHGGHGIGLYIAKGITRLHGGDLKIAATGHEGTTMQVTLPKVRAFSDDLG